MAKNNITQYDATAANNTDIDSINIDEGMAASDVNNAIRSLMSHLKNVDTGSQALTALSVTGNVTVAGNIQKTSGDFTLDVAGTITLDADDAGTILVQDGGTAYGLFKKSSNDMIIQAGVQDGDVLIQGNDGGSIVTAVTFDMSEGGDTTFNSNIRTSAIIVQSSIGASGVARQTTASGSHVYTADQFRNSSGTQVGSIAVGTSATTYNTSSDYRLKENVSYEFDATTRLKQLKPARFNFIANADTTVDGFIAHEVSSIVPEAITGAKDATQKIQNVVLNADGSFLADNISEKKWTEGKANKTYAEDTTWVATKTVPDYQSIDQSKLVPLLTKALQEQQATIEALTARITALENA